MTYTEFHDSQQQSAGRWRSAFLFWGSLLLALLGVGLAYRVSAPASGLCAEQVVNMKSNTAVSLPLYVAPDRARDSTLVLEHRFFVDPKSVPRLAVYLDQMAPFQGLRLNSRDLTPNIDLGRRDQRDRAPHLYTLPMDALLAGENVLTLQMPVSRALGATYVGMICVGDDRELRQVYRANWWRQVGVPYLCLALFIVLAATTLALRRLDRSVPFYLWYAGCLLLMMCRTAYLVIVDMPGGPIVWRAASELSTLSLVYATYRLMTLFWGTRCNRWGLIWLIVACLLQSSLAWLNWDLEYPLLKTMFWFSTAAIAVILMADLSSRARHAPAVERRSMRWVVLFAIVCAVLEVISLRLAPRQRLSGILVPATAAVALTFGFLLIRRALLGTALLAHASRALSHSLDRALLPVPEQSAIMWHELSSSIANSERQRMLHDINVGFGSRMLTVLEQIRRENPRSRLGMEIQRALLDLRLMIDAMDDNSRSIRGALSALRQRMEAPLSAAGVNSTWDIADISDLQVNNRRKLMELFRCLEELLSNVVQHARATRVLIFGRSNHAQLVLRVEDNGRGLPQTIAHGRGLRNVKTRMQMLHGKVTFGTGECGRGTQVELSMPRI